MTPLATEVTIATAHATAASVHTDVVYRMPRTRHVERAEEPVGILLPDRGPDEIEVVQERTQPPAVISSEPDHVLTEVVLGALVRD